MLKKSQREICSVGRAPGGACGAERPTSNTNVEKRILRFFRERKRPPSIAAGRPLPENVSA
jgi:hypothetical protein